MYDSSLSGLNENKKALEKINGKLLEESLLSNEKKEGDFKYGKNLGDFLEQVLDIYCEKNKNDQVELEKITEEIDNLALKAKKDGKELSSEEINILTLEACKKHPAIEEIINEISKNIPDPKQPEKNEKTEKVQRSKKEFIDPKKIKKISDQKHAGFKKFLIAKGFKEGDSFFIKPRLGDEEKDNVYKIGENGKEIFMGSILKLRKKEKPEKIKEVKIKKSKEKKPQELKEEKYTPEEIREMEQTQKEEFFSKEDIASILNKNKAEKNEPSEEGNIKDKKEMKLEPEKEELPEKFFSREEVESILLKNSKPESDKESEESHENELERLLVEVEKARKKYARKNYEMMSALARIKKIFTNHLYSNAENFKEIKDSLAEYQRALEKLINFQKEKLEKKESLLDKRLNRGISGLIEYYKKDEAINLFEEYTNLRAEDWEKKFAKSPGRFAEIFNKFLKREEKMPTLKETLREMKRDKVLTEPANVPVEPLEVPIKPALEKVLLPDPKIVKEINKKYGFIEDDKPIHKIRKIIGKLSSDSENWKILKNLKFSDLQDEKYLSVALTKSVENIEKDFINMLGKEKGEHQKNETVLQWLARIMEYSPSK